MIPPTSTTPQIADRKQLLSGYPRLDPLLLNYIIERNSDKIITNILKDLTQTGEPGTM